MVGRPHFAQDDVEKCLESLDFMQFNWPVIGHQKIIKYLQTVIENDRVSHAYCFYGAKNLGKSAVAGYFIRTIFCLSENIKPCGACSHCQQIKRGAHPDIIYLEREEDKKNISVQQARAVRGRLQSGSFLNSYKAVAVKEANLLSTEASNALLKILEEPMGKTLFIFLAESLKEVPATILSRTQVIKFLPVSRREIARYLMDNLKENREEADKLARLALGYPGRIIDLAGHHKITNIKEKNELNFLDQIFGNINARFALAERLSGQTNSAKTRQAVDIWLDELLFIARDIVLIKNMSFGSISQVWLRDKWVGLAGEYSTKKLIEIIEKISLTKNMIKQNVNPRLALERLMLEF